MPDTPPSPFALLEATRAHESATAMIRASSLFLVLTVIGMLVYPGGSYYDHHADHYVFLANFFSDLGATRTQTGANNALACALFILALGSLGVALINFWPAARCVSGGATTHKRIVVTSQVMALLAGLCFIGVAAVPHNINNALHLTFVKAAFVFLLGFIGPLTYLLKSFKWPRRDFWIGMAYVIGLVAYVINLFFGPSIRTQWGFSFQVVTQKVFVYYSVATVAVLALAVRREAAARIAALPADPDVSRVVGLAPDCDR
jgi:hypothetical protein